MRVEIVLALLSTASFAASHVVSRRGLQGTSITAAFIVVVSCAWVVVSIPLFLDAPASVPGRSIALFAISGVFAPAVARGAALAGVRTLGPSIAVPIQQGLRPLLILPLAAVALGEGLGPLRILGALSIVAGGWVLSRRPAGLTADVPPGAVAEGEANSSVKGSGGSGGRWSAPIGSGFRPGIMYPVVAAVAYSTADLLVKSGLDPAFNPAFGATVAIGSGLGVWSAAHALPSVRRRFRVGSDVGWLVLSGALMGGAILLLFNALERGELSQVVPVVATQPLFVFLFSTLILRHLEQLEHATLIAGVMVVIGTILVSR